MTVAQTPVSPVHPPCSCQAALVDPVLADPASSAALLIAVLRQITTAAATDARTGLLTHDAWQHAARRALADRTPCALLIIDLDHFKQVNGAHGHLVGDRLLAVVATEIWHDARAAAGLPTEPPPPPLNPPRRVRPQPPRRGAASTPPRSSSNSE